MHKRLLFSASLAALIAVALGAFAAHGLRGKVDGHLMEVFQTAVRYHFFHALGLAVVALLAKDHPHSKNLERAGWLMLAGILIFSGSLYLLVLSGWAWLGMVTPFGGAAFLAAWGFLAWFAWKEAE